MTRIAVVTIAAINRIQARDDPGCRAKVAT
jgi:hypothetical protein